MKRKKKVSINPGEFIVVTREMARKIKNSPPRATRKKPPTKLARLKIPKK